MNYIEIINEKPEPMKTRVLELAGKLFKQGGINTDIAYNACCERALELIAKATRNDDVRQNLGTGNTTVVTDGVRILTPEQQSRLYEMIRVFNTFTEDNDPYNEHDFGNVELDGDKYFWKIDDYGENYKEQEAPARLVMTVMRSDEY